VRHGPARGEPAQSAESSQHHEPGGDTHAARRAQLVPGLPLCRNGRVQGCRGQRAEAAARLGGQGAGVATVCLPPLRRGTRSHGQHLRKPLCACTHLGPPDVYDGIKHLRERGTAMLPHVFKSVMYQASACGRSCFFKCPA